MVDISYIKLYFLVKTKTAKISFIHYNIISTPQYIKIHNTHGCIGTTLNTSSHIAFQKRRRNIIIHALGM